MVTDQSSQQTEVPSPTATQTQPTRRTLTRWVLFALNALPFGVVVLLMERGLLCAGQCSNDLRLGLGIWALFVLAHLLITGLLDVREGFVYARREQRARRQAEIQKKRARMLEKLYSTPTDS